jgi:hypothetical protein
MTSLKRRILVLGLLGVGMTGAFYAGVASAADDRLNTADAAIQQAIVLLKAAQNPGRTPPFGGHRAAAIAALQTARKQIQKAKEYADKPPPSKPGKGDKDDKNHGKHKGEHHH